MRKLALLAAGGALWLFVAALPVLADGGPHVLTTNNGTTGLAGDCASCHRAHTAQASSLLKETMPGLCTNCHNGTKATTDVGNGVQYVPAGQTGAGSVLGALRGGGFTYALINTAQPVRHTYLGLTQYINFTQTIGSFQLTVNGLTTGVINFDLTNTTTQGATKTAIQNALTAPGVLGTTVALAAPYVPAQPNATVGNWDSTNLRFSVSFQNNAAFVASPPAAMIVSNPPGGTVSVTLPASGYGDTRQLARVGVLNAVPGTAGTTVTSAHQGTGTVWGNGAIGSTGAVGVTLECGNCHNPHGNGQYRILSTDPGGSDWSTSVPAFTSATYLAKVTEDVPTILATGQVRNYTVLPGLYTGTGSSYALTSNLTTDVVGTAAQGDYFRKKVPAWDYTTLGTDNYEKGATFATTTTADQTTMTAWCLTCHTRYNGQPNSSGASSLYDTSGGDPLFMFKHGTTGVGCEECHVSHGSNAVMSAQFSSTVEWPGGTTGSNDSRLLKVDNRGTCQLCHDPTGTVKGGTYAPTGTYGTSVPTAP